MLGFIAPACKAKLDRVLRQFALGLLQLILQAAQHALAAAAVVVVVFHKVHIHAGDLVEILLVEAFKKEAPRIAKDLGLEDEQVGDVGGGDGVGHGCNNRGWLFSAAGIANQGCVCSGPFGHGGFAGCPALVLLKL